MEHPERTMPGAKPAVPTGESTDATAFRGEPVALRRQRRRTAGTAETVRDSAVDVPPLAPDDRVIDVREEELMAHREMHEVSGVVVRKHIDRVPGRMEVDALRDEVEIEHIPAGDVVSERRRPWEEDGALIVPVYEEQLVLVKRLVMREKIRIRCVQTRERRLFEETLRKERLAVTEEGGTGRAREVYPTDGVTERRAAMTTLPIDADPPPHPADVPWAEKVR